MRSARFAELFFHLPHLHRLHRSREAMRQDGRIADFWRSSMAAAALSQSRHPLIPKERCPKIDQEGGKPTVMSRHRTRSNLR